MQASIRSALSLAVLASSASADPLAFCLDTTGGDMSAFTLDLGTLESSDLERVVPLGSSLAYDAERRELLSFSIFSWRIDGVDYAPGDLVGLDPATRAVRRVAPTGLTNITGAAFDADNRRVYVFEQATRRVHRVDPETGVAEAVTEPVPGVIACLAYDPTRSAVYLVDFAPNPDALLRVDVSTGEVTTVGPIANAGLITGLHYDMATDRLIAADAGADRLLSIDPETASPTVLSDSPFSNLRAIALIDPPSPMCNGADLAEPFGVLDIADVVSFLQRFGVGDDGADLAPPAGVFDIADVVGFLQTFGTGCP